MSDTSRQFGRGVFAAGVGGDGGRIGGVRVGCPFESAGYYSCLSLPLKFVSHNHRRI